MFQICEIRSYNWLRLSPHHLHLRLNRMSCWPWFVNVTNSVRIITFGKHCHVMPRVKNHLIKIHKIYIIYESNHWQANQSLDDKKFKVYDFLLNVGKHRLREINCANSSALSKVSFFLRKDTLSRRDPFYKSSFFIRRCFFLSHAI